MEINDLPTLTLDLKANGRGTINFLTTPSFWYRYKHMSEIMIPWISSENRLDSIADARMVYDLIRTQAGDS
ncbi:MAG: hypothetical protein O2812_05495 [Chloroflexi bacterium]|nr:hypothetical protein [Chloroflexota bacterium]